jgi:hypothetical protein
LGKGFGKGLSNEIGGKLRSDYPHSERYVSGKRVYYP